MSAVAEKPTVAHPFCFSFLDHAQIDLYIVYIPYMRSCACMLTRFDAHKSGIRVKSSITASYLEICLYQLHILDNEILLYLLSTAHIIYNAGTHMSLMHDFRTD